MKQYYKPGKTTIVFDGYPDEAAAKSTKSAERLRRKNKYSAANVIFTESMTPTMPKEQFLSNDTNKERLISMLCEKLVHEGFEVKQAFEDADTLIVTTAIEMAENFQQAIIVGEDTDLLVLLTAREPSSSNIYVMKPGKGTSQTTMYSPAHFNYSSAVKENILFLHAFSGCDTTSAFFRQGKIKFVKLLENNPNLQEAVQCFKNPDASAGDVGSAGQRFLAALYSSKQGETSLDTICYTMFSKSLSKTGFNLASLPPINAAAVQHSLRVYHQIQLWCGRDKDPLSWGWRTTNHGLLPITTSKEPAPAEVLNTVSCRCAKGCRGKCSCRKVSMKCSSICLNCKGQACSNAASEDEVLSHISTFSSDEENDADEFEDYLEDGDEKLDSISRIGSLEDEGPSTSKRRC